VKKGMSSNFLKIIQFNGIDGIKSISEKMQNLTDGLIKIVKDVQNNFCAHLEIENLNCGLKSSKLLLVISLTEV
jgi:hypothetical protein